MSCSRLRDVFASLLVLVLVSQCQPVPRPFQPTSKAAQSGPLLDIGARGGVLVAPLGGVDPLVGDRLRRALAADLRDRDIPASTWTAHRNSYLLEGLLVSQEAVGDDTALSLQWRLVGPRGLVVGTIEQEERIATGLWQRGGDAVLDRVAGNAAPRLEALIRAGDARVQGDTVRLLVRPIDGAPGDGRQSVTRALLAALKRAGLAARRDDGALAGVEDGAVVVLGSVHLQDRGLKRQHIGLVWTLIRSDGVELGRVQQGNDIRKGSLDGPWGEVALIVADGAADGIAKLLRRVDATALRPDAG